MDRHRNRGLTADTLLRVIDRMYFVWVALGFAGAATVVWAARRRRRSILAR